MKLAWYILSTIGFLHVSGGGSMGGVGGGGGGMGGSGMNSGTATANAVNLLVGLSKIL